MTELGARIGRRLKFVRNWMTRNFCAREVVRLYCHDLVSIPEITQPEGSCVSELDFARIECLQEIRAQDPADIAGRQERGDRCYIATLDGRSTHFSWVQIAGRHPLARTGRAVSIERGEFWIYHCVTAEWARGRGLYPFVLGHILRDYKKAGFSRCWIYTTSHNTASQRGILRAGFARQRDLKALMFCGRAIPLGETT